MKSKKLIHWRSYQDNLTSLLSALSSHFFAPNHNWALKYAKFHINRLNNVNSMPHPPINSHTCGVVCAERTCICAGFPARIWWPTWTFACCWLVGARWPICICPCWLASNCTVGGFWLAACCAVGVAICTCCVCCAGNNWGFVICCALTTLSCGWPCLCLLAASICCASVEPTGRVISPWCPLSICWLPPAVMIIIRNPQILTVYINDAIWYTKWWSVVCSFAWWAFVFQWGQVINKAKTAWPLTLMECKNLMKLRKIELKCSRGSPYVCFLIGSSEKHSNHLRPVANSCRCLSFWLKSDCQKRWSFAGPSN